MMGRMTAYDQYGRMVSDFDKSDYDFLCRYGRKPEEVMEENAKLRELLQDVAICACGRYCYGCPHQYDGCDRDKRLRAEGIEVGE